jgi:lipopolysaccharide/colanic/teichoic acid biosynthesis glycosyltransferase
VRNRRATDRETAPLPPRTKLNPQAEITGEYAEKWLLRDGVGEMAASAHTVRVGQIDLGSPADALDRILVWAARYQRETVAPVLKGLFDKIVATVALIVFGPVLALITLAIALNDGGPALFTQTRVGRGGQPFTVLKFRTMVPDAELRKEALLAQNEGDGLLFKLRQDPRITAVGRFLRRTSLDELPQLLNVMLGDMSLVGPRPALPVEVAQYSDNVARRLEVKPGMTGLWQIGGRSDLSHEDAVRLDLRYVDCWTLALDLRILWKTGAAVANGRGAY